MSSRFGRNKRRRLQTELENVKFSLEMTEGLLKHTSSKVDKLQNILDQASYVLGGNHISLPPKLKCEHPVRTGEVWGVQPSIKMDLNTHLRDATFQPIEYKIHRMHTLLVSSQNVDGALHLRTRLADGSVAYNISEEALRTAPQDYLEGVLTQEIARSVSKLLIKFR